jgi:hypothetical protein
MNTPSRCHSENLALHPRVMVDTPTLTGAPLVGAHRMVPDSLAHAEILKKCSVSRYVEPISSVGRDILTKHFPI